MTLFQKNHGAISVFLILILVPCMLISSIFVDISRVQLSKAVAESSAELALNTLKTYYDYDLSQYYGLMGSCQNIGDYYSTVSEYYEQALHSRDVEEEEILLLYQRVMKDMAGRFSDEKISDILLVRNETEGAVVSEVSGANMHNSTILHRQIVEFMKYRAPIVIVQELIELMQEEKDRGGIEDSEESNVNKPMLDAQEEYYKAEGELLKQANKSYWALREYTRAINEDGIVTSTLHTYADRMAAYRTAYKEIHGLMVKNLYNTSGLPTYTRPTVALDAHTYSKEDDEISYLPTPAPPEPPAPSDADSPTEPSNSSDADAPAEPPESEQEPEYHVKAEKVKELTSALESAISNFKEKKEALTAAGSNLMSVRPGTGDNDSYAIQWWVQMNGKINASGGMNLSAEVWTAGDEMIDAYGKVCAMLECTPDTEDSWWGKAKELKTEAEGLQGDCLSAASTADNDYMNTVRLLESVSADNINKIKYTNLSVTVNGESRTIPDALSMMSSDLSAMKQTADKYIECLNDIIDGNSGKDIPSLNSIKGLISTYGRKLNDWESKANGTKVNGSNTSMSEEHLETIRKIRNGAEDVEGSKSEKIVKEITVEKLNQLEARLKNIRSQFQAVSDAIESMQYGGRKVKDIADYATFQAAAAGQIQAGDIPLANKALNNYADNKFAALFRPDTGEVVVLKDISDLSYSPVLQYDNQEKDNVPELYIQYYKLFENKKPSDVAGEKGKLDNKTENSKEQAGVYKDKGRYHGPKDRDISELTSKPGNAFNLGSALLGSMMGLINILLQPETGLTEIRDKLYVTEYIMNMFSYATFENENYYDLVKEAGKLGELSLEGEGYKTVYSRDEFKGAADKDHTWLSENPEDSYNKTLTNEMINSANNYAYQAEVEYILFGENNERSVKEAYWVIYEIRYLLNLVSAFANFWSTTHDTGKVINVIANGIAELTAFIIPAPLVKIILLPILTIFETGKDLDRLEAGFPVELYKSADDWWISAKGGSVEEFYNALKGGSSKKIEEAHGWRYSDYLIIFVYLGLNDENCVDGMYQRMADVIGKNMQLRTGDTDYSLEKTQVYFQLKSKLRVDPLMLTLPYYSDYVEDPTMKDDWCTFEVDTIRGY